MCDCNEILNKLRPD